MKFSTEDIHIMGLQLDADDFLSVFSKFFQDLMNFCMGDIHKNFLSNNGFCEKWYYESGTLLRA